MIIISPCRFASKKNKVLAKNRILKKKPFQRVSAIPICENRFSMMKILKSKKTPEKVLTKKTFLIKTINAFMVI